MSMDGLPPGARRTVRGRRNVQRQAADDAEAEIRFHLQSRIDVLMAEGLERGVAEERALAEFGDVDHARRALAHESARTERRRRRLEWMHAFVEDVRYGWRRLWARPGFAAVAILTLTLGIGANTAIFSVVYAVLLRPLPYHQPDRLVQIWEVRPRGDDHNVVSSGNYLDWRERTQSFQDLGAYSGTFGLGLMAPDARPEHVVATNMSPSIFRLLGVPALRGRTFTAEEGESGGERVVVLSHRLWQTRLGSSPNVVGTRLTLDDNAYTVVGVMPADFDFPSPNIDLWLPTRFGAEDRTVRRSHQWRVIGRLKDGVSLSRAQAELDGIAAQLAVEHPQYMEGWGVNARPFRADLVSSVRPLLLILFGVVLLVLLIACANLANLLLVQALGREREVAVRAALGAGRGRLVLQFVTESLLVALLGGAAGAILVTVGLRALVALAPSDIPLLEHTRADPVVLAFAAGATLVATILFGILPAFRVTDLDLQSSLRSGRSGASGVRHGRLRAGLLVAEVALSVVLLVGAGLLVRSFVKLQAVDLGFEPDHLLTVMLDIPRARYPETPEQAAFYRELLQRVGALPGVVSAAGTAEPPVIGYRNTFSFAIEGRPSEHVGGREDPWPLRAVTPRFVRTMGISLLRGREIDATDRPGAPLVVVINAAMAQRYWPNDDPLGHRISFEGPDGPDWWEIVGLVGNTKSAGADQPADPAVYIPQAQKPWGWMSWMTIVARTEGDPLALADGFRNALRQVDDQLPVERLTTMNAVYAESNARRRFAATLMAGFAALALVLGVVGIYGVLSYVVGQRAREFGVRMALGAGRSAIAGGVVRQGLLIAATGALIGLLAAFLLSRFLKGLLYEVAATDPFTFVLVPAVLIAVAALAAYLPARRATRIDPMEALRAE